MSITSTEEVTQVLREHIMSGQIHPGERLQQERLARFLGVSRTPLRTALAALTLCIAILGCHRGCIPPTLLHLVR